MSGTRIEGGSSLPVERTTQVTPTKKTEQTKDQGSAAAQAPAQGVARARDRAQVREIRGKEDVPTELDLPEGEPSESTQEADEMHEWLEKKVRERSYPHDDRMVEFQERMKQWEKTLQEITERLKQNRASTKDLEELAKHVKDTSKKIRQSDDPKLKEIIDKIDEIYNEAFAHLEARAMIEEVASKWDPKNPNAQFIPLLKFEDKLKNTRYATLKALRDQLMDRMANEPNPDKRLTYKLMLQAVNKEMESRALRKISGEDGSPIKPNEPLPEPKPDPPIQPIQLDEEERRLLDEKLRGADPRTQTAIKEMAGGIKAGDVFAEAWENLKKLEGPDGQGAYGWLIYKRMKDNEYATPEEQVAAIKGIRDLLMKAADDPRLPKELRALAAFWFERTQGWDKIEDVAREFTRTN